MSLDVGSLFAFSVSSFLTAFFLLFSVVNAIGTVPLFLSLTRDAQDKRSLIVRQAVIIATVILVIFAVGGLFIFQVIGITLNDFKIAGGIILFIIAIDNLRGGLSQMKTTDAIEMAAFPLATPLLAGPGAISTVIIFASAPYGLFEDLLVILLNSVLMLVILGRATLVQKLLGPNGTQVFTRIVGLLIAAIGIAFIREGIVGIYQSLLPGGG